jgi:hypothetical protein
MSGCLGPLRRVIGYRKLPARENYGRLPSIVAGLAPKLANEQRHHPSVDSPLVGSEHATHLEMH